jgi:hypothetical protein
MLAVCIGGSVSASRGVFAMARDRRVPGALAIVSRRRGTPLGATVFVVVASLATLAVDQWWKGLFALPATPHYFAIFSWGSTILITGGAIFGSFYKVTSPTILAPWFALAVLIIGFGSTFVVRPRQPARARLTDLTSSAVS